MTEILKIFGEHVSLVVHLGDTVSDARRLKVSFPDIPFLSVKGNNDFFESEADEEYIYIFEGLKCFFTHGHRYAVKSDLLQLNLRAGELGIDIVMFGHTHSPLILRTSETLFLNPGTVGCFSYGVATFALVELENGNVLSSEILSYNPINKQIDFWKAF